MLAAVAALASLAVYLWNGAPLFYYDTAGYLSQGHSMVDAISQAVMPAAPVADGGPAPAAAIAPDTSVDASRSAVYALALASLDALAGLDAAVFVNLALIWLALFLAARHLGDPGLGPALRLSSLGLLAASLGALPFYVAFLMPDILAAVMIVLLALIFTYLPKMTRGELLTSGALALAAIVAHPSHLLVAAALLPIGLFASPVMAQRRLWVSVALIGLLVGVGVAEKFIFGAAVSYFEKKEARYLPFLTARLIVDGPGMVYLQDHCPDQALATCALYDRLSGSEREARLFAPIILFSASPETGSYRLLTDDQQQAISQEQPAFVLSVIRDAPLAVLGTLVRNTAVQLGYYRVDMTVPDPGLLAKLQSENGQDTANLRNGRLVETALRWKATLSRLHGLVYALSVVAIGWSLVRTRRARPDLRVFAGLVLTGIVVNALVCGGVSEPADRYGARVMFLLPALAAMLWAAGQRWGGQGSTAHPA